MKSIAIFGGTFDPIHKGHVRSAEELKQLLAIDEVRLLPCHIPPHRQLPNCHHLDRLAMLKLAVMGTDLLVDDRELKQDRISYSVDTLEQCREEFGGEVALSWVMGTDAFAKLDSWHRWQDFLSLANIIVIQRPDCRLPTAGPIATLLEQHRLNNCQQLTKMTHGGIGLIELTPHPIAATVIRQKVKEGKEVSGYLLPSVLDYIKNNHLYH